jgi:SHS2 domain-containing protein
VRHTLSAGAIVYELFGHTADLGIRVRAATLGDLMADAARGLFTVIAGDLTQINAIEERPFALPGTDPTWLLHDWMSELLAVFEIERLLLREFTVTVDETGLRATARGETFDPSRHTLAHEIKAVTQHLLEVRHGPAGWEAECIVDI